MVADSPTIFLTGATGFVGGSILAWLYQTHQNIRTKVLVRNEDDGAKLESVFCNLEPIIGSLSDTSLLASTAAKVDFVIHAAGDSIGGVCALIDGLVSGSAVGQTLPRLISISGTRSLIDTSLPVTGNAHIGERPWSDTIDAREILSLPHSRWHAKTDQAIVEYGAAKEIGAMIVAPGQLWGQGKGQFRKEGKVASIYHNVVRSRGRAFVIGDGSAVWSWSSITDLSRAVVHLVEQSLLRGERERARVGINEDGYYFVQSGDVSMMERAQVLSGRLGFGEVESIPVEVAAEMHPLGPLMWGCGAKFRADKLAKLDWSPKEFDWKQLMEEGDGLRG